MGSTKSFVAFLLAILLVISSIDCRTVSRVPSGFGVKEAVDPWCYDGCSETYGDKECTTDCVQKNFRVGYCLPIRGPGPKRCCCSP